MSYDLKLFRKEIRKQYDDLSFLENEDSISPFTNEQIERLKKRLALYQYQIENESEGLITYNFKGGQLGITVYLSKTSLTFKCAGGNEEGLFEIMQTSDEFSDSEFLTLNLQDGTWSGMCLETELEAEISEEDSKVKSIVIENINLDNKTNSKPWWKFW